MADEKKRMSPGLLERLDASFPLRLLGFGFIYAWGVCLWDIPLALSPTGTALQADAAWLLSAILTPAACLVIAFAGRGSSRFTSRGAAFSASLMCMVGSLALAACGFAEGWLRILLEVVAGVGTGCGPAFLIVSWGCLFSRIEASIVETVVPASFVVTLLCALIIPALAPLTAVVLVACLPLASGLLLILSSRALDHQTIPAEKPSDVSTFTIHRRSIMRMVAAIFILYTLGCAAPAESPWTTSASLEASATAVGMFFAVALSVAIVLFARRIDVTSLYRWITIPFVASIIAIPFPDASASFLARVLMNTVFTGIEIIALLYFIRLSQRTNRPAAFCVGLSAAASYGGVLAGYPLGDILTQMTLSPETSIFGCLVILGVFTLTSLLIPSHDETLEEAPAGSGKISAPAAAVASRVIEPQEKAAISETNTAGANDGAGRASTVADSYAAEVGSMIEHRTALAASFGLSNRETEIFLLLAQGRSRPYIRDTLYLSKNTVATHIRHIYEKLGIHSQQELIDLVEE